MGALCIEEPHHCSEHEFRLPLRIHGLQISTRQVEASGHV